MRKLQKNFRVLNEIKNYELLEEVNKALTSDDSSAVIVNETFISKNEAFKGIHYMKNNRNRYFCSCGYIGESSKSICNHCGNNNFLKIHDDYHNSMKLYMNKALLSYVELVNEDNVYKLKLVKLTYTLLDNDSVLSLGLVSDNILEISDSDIKVTNNDELWNYYIDYLRIHSSSINRFVKNLTIKDEIELLVDVLKKHLNYNQDYYLTINNLIILLGMQKRGVDITDWLIPEYYNLFKYEFRNLRLILNNDTRLPYTKEFNFFLDTMSSIETYLSKQDLSSEVRDVNVKDTLKAYFGLDISVIKDIDRIAKSFNNESKKRLFLDMVYNGDVSIYDYYKSPIDNHISSEINVIKNHYDTFKEYYYRYKDVYNLSIIRKYDVRRYNLKKYNLEDKSILYSNEFYYSLINKDYLVSIGYSEDKSILIDRLMEVDPLKAYELMSSKKKLTKKDKEEMKKLII